MNGVLDEVEWEGKSWDVKWEEHYRGETQEWGHVSPEGVDRAVGEVEEGYGRINCIDESKRGKNIDRYRWRSSRNREE